MRAAFVAKRRNAITGGFATDCGNAQEPLSGRPSGLDRLHAKRPDLGPDTKPAPKPAEEDPKAVAALEKLGVKLKRDEKQPGKPVIEVDFGAITTTDEMLAHQGVSARTREAVYYYATGRARYKRVAFSRAALDARFSEFLTILDTIATGIAQGMFPQHPGDRGENCKWCAFKPVCGQGRVTLAERKAGDPRLSALHAMWSIQ